MRGSRGFEQLPGNHDLRGVFWGIRLNGVGAYGGLRVLGLRLIGLRGLGLRGLGLKALGVKGLGVEGVGV